MDDKGTGEAIAQDLVHGMRDEVVSREPVVRSVLSATGSQNGRSSMARKKISTTVYIEPEQAEQLKLLHERTKVPVAVYIREGIELVLAKYQHLLPGQLTLDVNRQQG